MQIKSIAECSKWIILQLFLTFCHCLFFSGRFTQVLLYTDYDYLVYLFLVFQIIILHNELFHFQTRRHIQLMALG